MKSETGLGLHQHPNFVYASRRGSDETAHMHRLIWAFAVLPYNWVQKSCDRILHRFQIMFAPSPPFFLFFSLLTFLYFIFLFLFFNFFFFFSCFSFFFSKKEKKKKKKRRRKKFALWVFAVTLRGLIVDQTSTDKIWSILMRMVLSVLIWRIIAN